MTDPSSLVTYAIFTVFLLTLGAVTGLVAGLFGVGGGILIIPALSILFKISGIPNDTAMHAAVGISMMVIVPTSYASLNAHRRHKAIDTNIVRQWAAPVIVGSVFGALMAMHLSGKSLSFLFSIFVAVMAAYLGFAPGSVHEAKRAPRALAQKAAAFSISFFSAMVGSGGSLMVPTMVIFRMPIHRAIGTASAIGLMISLPAATVYLVAQLLMSDAVAANMGNSVIGNLPYLNLIIVALLVPTTMLMAPVGARLTYKVPDANLRRAFALLLAVIAMKMLVTSLND